MIFFTVNSIKYYKDKVIKLILVHLKICLMEVILFFMEKNKSY